MLTDRDLNAIDRLIEKRNLESEKRLDKKISTNKNYLLKIINFLDNELLKLTKRIERLEKKSLLS